MKAKALHNSEKCAETEQKRRARQEKKLASIHKKLATAGVQYGLQLSWSERFFASSSRLFFFDRPACFTFSSSYSLAEKHGRVAADQEAQEQAECSRSGGQGAQSHRWAV